MGAEFALAVTLALPWHIELTRSGLPASDDIQTEVNNHD